ncbi:MAG: cytochrome c oxidase subunit 3 [Pseudomonadota bacterium]
MSAALHGMGARPQRAAMGDDGVHDGGSGLGRRAGAPLAVRKVGLWVFMAVVTALFMLFGIAYLMRMAAGDWRALPVVPWQLWLSTGLLALASAAWEVARRFAARGRAAAMRQAGLAACILSLAFLAVQWWAWLAMTAMHYRVDGNPANSFFYLLTGLHGLHVIGGLVAAAWAGAGLARRDGAVRLSETMALCAQYWHYLFALWLLLFALLFYVTPELVQVVCESVGIAPPQAR